MHTMAYARVDETVGLKALYKLTKLEALLGNDIVGEVEPDELERAVVCEQLLDLRNALISEILLKIDIAIREIPIISVLCRYVLESRDISRTVLLVPVEGVRIVESYLESLLVAGINELAANISAVVVVGVVAVNRTLEEAEAVVMLARQNYVANTCILRPLYEIFCKIG